MSPQEIQIVPLTRFNWELALEIRLHPEQEAFLPTVSYSLAQSKFEDLHPFGIMYGDKMAGFIMYGVFGGICWISRLMVDRDFQGKGIGSEALSQMIRHLEHKVRCPEIRTSYSSSNEEAKRLFAIAGFQEINTELGDEIVARLEK
jgi:diamine N-acetyltransferase